MSVMGSEAESTPGQGRQDGGNYHGVSSGIDMPDEDDDANFGKEETSMLMGFFGVIYTVSRERIVSWQFVAFKILLDLWQLLTLIINPVYGWVINGDARWWKVISFIQLNDFMMARGLPFFLACLYIFVVLLVFTLVLCIWVAWSFKNQQFDYVWPITFLRFFGVVFFQMLDVASMALFFMALDCQYFSVSPDLLGFNQEFPDQYCWAMPFMIHSAVAAMSLVVFVTLAVAFQMGEMELNMVTRNLLGMAHSKAEVLSFLLKFLMTGATVFLNSLYWLSIFQMAGSMFLLYLALQWESYYHGWVNHARAGIYGALFYCALVMVFLVYAPYVDITDSIAVHAHQQTCTFAVVAGIVPAAGLAVLASIMRLRYVQSIIKKFRAFKPGSVKSKLIHKFKDAREVELCARCCRKWVDEDTLDEAAVELAFVILKAGMEQLPGDAFLIILYSSFLIDVKGGYQSGLCELPAARKAEKSILEKFALFSREQLHTQKSSGAKGSQGADLVSYVEQQRSYRMALKVNKEAFEATSAFWASLLKPQVQLRTLNKRVAVLDACVEEAVTIYRQLLQRSPDNWMLLRMYGVFLEMIRNDPWGAGKNFAEADRLMQAEEDAKHSAFMTESLSTTTVDKSGDDSGDAFAKAVIIINARCIIQNANKVACDATGYTQKELLGKNINMLIPRPFSDQHDQYVLRHVTTGKSTILDRNMETVILHKDRYVMGVKILATKLAGFGMDSVFMGVFSTMPAPENTARVWVLSSGVILSVDSTFSDWFGYRPEDLPGAYFSTLVKDVPLLETAFKNKRMADVRSQSGDPSGESRTNINVNMHIKHKFAGLVECKVEMAAGAGARSYGNLSILIITRDVSESMLVSDGRGKLLHVSKTIADDLGFSVMDLLGELADNVWDVILPEPFSQMHQVHVTQELPPLYPPYSCRSGLSVCLLATTDEGPKPKPYKLKVRTRKLEKSGDPVNIVSLQASSMEKAMDERRLSVMLDQAGLVTKVGGTPSALFGFDPQEMVGKPMSAFVDAFQTKEGTSDAVTSRNFHDLLLKLAIRSLEAPGESFRVGVTAPILDNVGDGELSGAIASHLHSKATSPAIMQVKVHFPGARKPCQGALEKPQDMDASLKLVDSLLGSITEEHVGKFAEGTSPRRLHTPVAGAARMDSPAEIHGKFSGGMSPLRLPSPVAPAARMDSSEEMHGLRSSKIAAADKACKRPGLNIGAGLVLEVNLWRADIMSGLLHLDSRTGRVTRTSDLPMHQPGLILGISDCSFVGRHISAILPLTAGQGVPELFLPDLGRGPKALIRSRKGGMKQDTGKAMKEFEAGKPGPVSFVTAKHLTDGQMLNISVQAINVKRYKRETCVMIHLVNPWTGHPDFKQILLDNPPKCHVLCHKQLAASEEQLESVSPNPPTRSGFGGKAAAAAARSGTTGRPPGSGGARLRYDSAIFPGADRTSTLSGPLSLDDLVQELQHNDSAPGDMHASGAVSDDEKGPYQVQQRASSWVLSGGKPDAGQLATLQQHSNVENCDDDDYVCYSGAGLNRIEEQVSGGLEAHTVTPFASHPHDDQAQNAQMLGQDTDMRRGQRYKKVSRILTHDSSMHGIRMFKYQAYGAIVFVVAVSIACFMAMYLPLTKQATGIVTLETIGEMGSAMGEIFDSVLSLDVLFNGLGSPGLQGLQGPDDIGRILNTLIDSSNNLQELISESFFEVLALSGAGLDTIWNEPSLNISLFNDGLQGSMPALTHKNFSLWDAGKLYLAASKNVWQNAYAHNATVTGGRQWRDWSYVLYITTNMFGMYTAVFATMEMVVVDVISSAASVNKIQLQLMALEGLLCSILVTIYIFYINSKVTKIQFHLFGPFILLPSTVIRGMCKIDMDTVVTDANKEVANVKVSGGKPSQQNHDGETVWEKVTRCLRSLAFWKKKVAPSGVYAPKRSLVTSARTALMMSLPFACWGIIIIAINVAGQAKLGEVNNSISIFNAVDNVQMKYFRHFGVVMDLTMTSNITLKAVCRTTLSNNFKFPLEYQNMLSGDKTPGASAVAGTSTKGITQAGSEGVDLLYHTKECMRKNVSSCMAPNATLYQYTVNGLDMAVQAHMDRVQSMINMTGSDPSLDSEEFNLIWNLRPDIIGGLTKLNHIYYLFVQSVYQTVLTIHIVGLVLSLLLMVIFYFCLLRPYLKELAKCRRRIAYLLSQLPNEIDVVALVKRSVANTIRDNQLFVQQSVASNSSMASSRGSSMGSEISFSA